MCYTRAAGNVLAVVGIGPNLHDDARAHKASAMASDNSLVGTAHCSKQAACCCWMAYCQVLPRLTVTYTVYVIACCVYLQVRMNGGTNIAAAVAKAGSLLKSEASTSRRVLVLLTDGRIDTYQVCTLA